MSSNPLPFAAGPEIKTSALTGSTVREMRPSGRANRSEAMFNRSARFGQARYFQKAMQKQ
jgi:hypothetical protein